MRAAQRRRQRSSRYESARRASCRRQLRPCSACRHASQQRHGEARARRARPRVSARSVATAARHCAVAFAIRPARESRLEEEEEGCRAAERPSARLSALEAAHVRRQSTQRTLRL